jgi:hypothetical protein
MDKHCGAVYIYDVSLSNVGNLNFTNYKSMIYSSLRSARFGRELTWLTNGNLMVSAPQQSSSFIFVPDDYGQIYHFANANTLSGAHESTIADATFGDSSVGCRLGDTMSYDTNSSYLLVASP